MPCIRNVGLPNRSHKSIYASGKKRSTVRVKCLARQEHDTMSPDQCWNLVRSTRYNTLNKRPRCVSPTTGKSRYCRQNVCLIIKVHYLYFILHLSQPCILRISIHYWLIPDVSRLKEGHNASITTFVQQAVRIIPLVRRRTHLSPSDMYDSVQRL